MRACQPARVMVLFFVTTERIAYVSLPSMATLRHQQYIYSSDDFTAVFVRMGTRSLALQLSSEEFYSTLLPGMNEKMLPGTSRTTNGCLLFLVAASHRHDVPQRLRSVSADSGLASAGCFTGGRGERAVLAVAVDCAPPALVA